MTTLEGLRAACAGVVVREPGAADLTDATEPRGLRGRADAVAEPETAEERGRRRRAGATSTTSRSSRAAAAPASPAAPSRTEGGVVCRSSA